MKNIKLDKFEGPLDLLLTLIEGQQLSITEVSLAKVTEQFLEFVQTSTTIQPTELADYLHIAAKLLVIKSRSLLPVAVEEEVEEDESAIDLEQRLALYQKFKEAMRQLKAFQNSPNRSFIRTKVFEQRVSFFPDTTLSLADLKLAAEKIVGDVKALNNLPKARIKEAISIQDKIVEIRQRIAHKINGKLSELIGTAKDSGEVIVTFLALLEMVKQRTIIMSQNSLFEDIEISSL